MQLAILHHHLNRGGVTSVIANHLRSLATLSAEERPQRVAIFFDGQRDGWPDPTPSELRIDMIEEPRLAYDSSDTTAQPSQLAEALESRFAEARLAPADTLLHVHNHSLGKNASLPGALGVLAARGWRMLLQVHDFAEDNRPENYRHLQRSLEETDADRLGAVLYPQASGVHYATLTQRDADVLRGAGLTDDRLHVLPNPVAEFGPMPSQEEARSRVYPALGLPDDARLVVYPVRGIRRKNVGEMLLLSALAAEGTWFAVTLGPKNPIEAASFDRWRRLAEALELPCRFDTEGAYGVAFHDVLAASDSVLTTSVAEGFGMVFLEAWLAGKPLVGRDLPEITREFKAHGVRFDGMWEELRAPSHLDRDFGMLKPAEQEIAIKLAKRPTPPIDLGVAQAAANVEHNAAIVRRAYSTQAMGDLLLRVYMSIGSAKASVDPIRGSAIVEHYANPSRQVPLRNEEPLSGPAAVIGRLSLPLEPNPTNEQPRIDRLDGVRAVVFDVYGTLLVSGSGDISLASEGSRGAAAHEALQATLSEPVDGDAIVNALHDSIREAHALSSSEHPEVEIREVWRAVLDRFGLPATDAQIESLAVEYECRVNPIWPMPAMTETLAALASAGLPLGIVSNAQFFTPLAFEPLCGSTLTELGFGPALCVWSYEHREAKPGTPLYERCAASLRAQGVEPGEALFVGNDLRNDVWPAQRVGFKAALFAGDARSLRWRRDDPLLADVRPDAVVTDLRQLLDLVV